MEKHSHVYIESVLLATISKEQRCGATISLSHAKSVSLWHRKILQIGQTSYLFYVSREST